MNDTMGGRMRILVLTSTFPRWEGDSLPRFVLDLSLRIGQVHDVIVLAPHSNGASRSQCIGNLQVCRFRYAPAALELLAGEGGILAGMRRYPWRILLVPFFVTAQFLATVRILRQMHVDVVHAHWLVPQGMVAVLAVRAASARAAILCTSHGGDLFSLPGRFLAGVKRYVAKRCTSIAVVSEAMRERIVEMCPEIQGRVVVAPMGADLETVFVPGIEDREHFTLLFVGRLVAKKGVAVLLNALQTVVQRVPHVCLRVIGEGPLFSELQGMARAMGLDQNVSWLGPMIHEQIASEYRRATMLVFPSVVTESGDQEGLGLVLVEAMGCGCPVIASNLPAVRDVIRDGETGMLVAPGSANGLSDAILRLLTDDRLRNSLGRRARDAVTKKFTWSSVSDTYLAIFDAIRPPNPVTGQAPPS